MILLADEAAILEAAEKKAHDYPLEVEPHGDLIRQGVACRFWADVLTAEERSVLRSKKLGVDDQHKISAWFWDQRSKPLAFTRSSTN